ncbi:MAG: thioredoxin [Oscillospiraceae bacterium]|jgi:thioredoxin 1|nr:thioredoxin [Oscillospiraceae bacterium]
MIIEFNSQNFNKEVLESKIPVIADFFASWCGPCKMLGPVIEQLSDEYNGKISVGKVDIDANIDLAQKYEVVSVPTVIFFENSEIKRVENGFIPKEQLDDIIKQTFSL